MPPIDPKKLVSMMRQGKPNEDGFAPGAGQEHHHATGPANEADDRKRAGGYMELHDLAGAFSCGTCRGYYLDDAGKGACKNPKIAAAVDADFGCCNYFFPSDPKLVAWPPELTS